MLPRSAENERPGCMLEGEKGVQEGNQKKKERNARTGRCKQWGNESKDRCRASSHAESIHKASSGTATSLNQAPAVAKTTDNVPASLSINDTALGRIQYQMEAEVYST